MRSVRLSRPALEAVTYLLEFDGFRAIDWPAIKWHLERTPEGGISYLGAPKTYSFRYPDPYVEGVGEVRAVYTYDEQFVDVMVVEAIPDDPS